MSLRVAKNGGGSCAHAVQKCAFVQVLELDSISRSSTRSQQLYTTRTHALNIHPRKAKKQKKNKAKKDDVQKLEYCRSAAGRHASEAYELASSLALAVRPTREKHPEELAPSRENDLVCCHGRSVVELNRHVGEFALSKQYPPRAVTCAIRHKRPERHVENVLSRSHVLHKPAGHRRSQKHSQQTMNDVSSRGVCSSGHDNRSTRQQQQQQNPHCPASGCGVSSRLRESIMQT